MDGYKMSTVLKRLEAAASRLEDVVMFAEARSASSNVDIHSENDGNSHSVTISPKSSAPLISVNGPAMPPAPETSPNKGLVALTSLNENRVNKFVTLSESFAAGIGKQAQAFADAFSAMIGIVKQAGQREKPEISELIELLKPMNSSATKVEQIRDEFRKDRELANFFATLSAGVGAFGWVTIDGKNKASDYIQEMKDSAQFYGNRVLKERKEAKAWVDEYLSILDDLKASVKEFYPDGLKWTGPVAPKSSTTCGAPPPPPPPPPSVEQLTAKSTEVLPTSNPETTGMSGVLAELNQGETIGSSLKKTDKAALKARKPPVSKSTKPKPGVDSNSTSVSSTTKLQPCFKLIESKWHVEDLENCHDIEIAATMDQSVQIDNCSNCTIKITGKAATFNVSRCAKVGLLVENMVASCDIVNCTNFDLQVTGTLPSLMIDQSHQISIYLSTESLGLDIFTSQSTTVNVNIPEAEPNAYRELPLGEQILHKFVNGSFESTIVKHA